uniref:hypothetical protein n=1 Tax=Sinorhizobium sp. M14 TaxID=430451 RepID=UPI0015672BC3|nr:hypothetical protein [Sinorhizobium sp. M14]
MVCLDAKCSKWPPAGRWLSQSKRTCGGALGFLLCDANNFLDRDLTVLVIQGDFGTVIKRYAQGATIGVTLPQ